ncbi:NF-kappa-B inhibitor cactus [Lepeophtheirus salmonis]|uniref:Uncharacterized protein n=1 Tax=Lepeophtheirus salmonis TaxID=72036 RepID=A0A0K2TX75_LEPSM|nr:NF-kappa-B inhibitor cactus-like [Lepeophtheirus salmonis]
MSKSGSGGGGTMSESLESTCSSRMEESMFDSGFSSGSLNPMCSSTESSSAANVYNNNKHQLQQMPLSSSLKERRLDSSGGLLVSDLSALSLSDNAKLNPDAWREYYEPDEDGDVQLHLAIASGFVEVVYALIRMVPNSEFLNIQNNHHYAPLHIAVLQNQPNIVRRLVVSGARLDVRDKEGNTPLHLAARRGNVECGEALLKSISVGEMCTRSLPSVPIDIIDLRNSQGEHSVHLATMGGHSHFLLFLSWNNADINSLDGRSGRSALHFAVGARNTAIIHTLIEPRPSGCGINPNLVDWYGRSAYQLALANAVPEIAQFLATRTGMSVDISKDLNGDDSSCSSSDEAPDEILSRPILNSA